MNGHEPPDVADQVASRAGRLPLCLFGMMVTAVQTFGFVVFESLPLVAALPFSAFWILGWMAACDGRSLLVDLIGPAQVEANLDDAACSTRRYTRRPAGVIARSGGVGISSRAAARVTTVNLAGMTCAPTVH